MASRGAPCPLPERKAGPPAQANTQPPSGNAWPIGIEGSSKAVGYGSDTIKSSVIVFPTGFACTAGGINRFDGYPHSLIPAVQPTSADLISRLFVDNLPNNFTPGFSDTVTQQFADESVPDPLAVLGAAAAFGISLKLCSRPRKEAAQAFSVIGLVCLGLGLVTLVFSCLPVRLMEPAWQLQLSGGLTAAGFSILIGTLLICTAGALPTSPKPIHANVKMLCESCT